MKVIRLALLVGLLASAGAHGAPFTGANAEAGRTLHATHCVACHSRQFGGDEGSQIYTRSERRVKSADALAQQITTCTTMLNLALFPEDELNLAGYLNARYYHFK